jgi:UDP-glucose:(heptosyl)LPS alpha-1,3-glucosyltransferase
MSASGNNNAGNPSREHWLLFEPRTEGHHLGWLRFITEDFLGAGHQLTLAVDLRPAARAQIEQHLGDCLSQVKLIAATGNDAAAVARCLRESGAANVFLCDFAEIASDCWRRAAFGLRPSAELRGRMGGIYVRPRFLYLPRTTPDRWLKHLGFRRLLNEGWLRQLLFLDESLVQQIRAELPGAPVFYLPDVCPDFHGGDATSARQQLGVPLDRPVFLFYGGGYRRKGLHLAVEAMREVPNAFLFCAGQLKPDPATARTLDELVRQNRARVLNRFVSSTEEELCFAAADAVLLPYVDHTGTSGVLSTATAAGKMVIVSDEHLLGRLTRDHQLGLLFPTRQVAGLRDKIRETAALSPAQRAVYEANGRRYAQQHSRETFRRALLDSLRRRPKVAVVIRKYGLVGGGERFAAEVTERLARTGRYEMHVFANRWHAVAGSPVVFHKVPLIRFPRTLRPWSFAWFAERMIARGQFDLIHSHDRLTRADVVSLHSVPHAGWIREVRRKRLSLFDRTVVATERRMLQNGQHTTFLPVSTLALEAFRRDYTMLPGRWQVLHPGVDAARFSAPDRATCRREIRQRYGITETDFLLLFVGMNFEVKGLDTIIRALAKTQAKLVVVGRGDESKYAALARSLGVNVTFAGTQTTGIERYYRAADAFILLSAFDTFGMVVLEAMAAGLPVIVSPNVGAKDLVVDGVNGFVVRDAAGAAARIGQCTEAMGTAAAQTAARHSWDELTRQLDAIYQTALAERRP